MMRKKHLIFLCCVVFVVLKKVMLTTVNLFLQLFYPLLVLSQFKPVSPSDVGQLLPLGVLQRGQFMLVFVHLPTHPLPQILRKTERQPVCSSTF